eukprot:TRINITY_DN7300_c0_g2_i2.p1 TRINITY_DN7300_c0_g2~~TRINITY_DN7300_c0_g2_i2.p1  ORF type:complete len:361 (-),score=80.71 TRINITY_DN7300_c0_g2_i2:947-2029(-)
MARPATMTVIPLASHFKRAAVVKQEFPEYFSGMSQQELAPYSIDQCSADANGEKWVLCRFLQFELPQASGTRKYVWGGLRRGNASRSPMYRVLWPQYMQGSSQELGAALNHPANRRLLDLMTFYRASGSWCTRPQGQQSSAVPASPQQPAVAALTPLQALGEAARRASAAGGGSDGGGGVGDNGMSTSAGTSSTGATGGGGGSSNSPQGDSTRRISTNARGARGKGGASPAAAAAASSTKAAAGKARSTKGAALGSAATGAKRPAAAADAVVAKRSRKGAAGAAVAAAAQPDVTAAAREFAGHAQAAVGLAYCELRRAAIAMGGLVMMVSLSTCVARVVTCCHWIFRVGTHDESTGAFSY